tara:strand:+ start:1009 stop:1128 length:120 start_codon:yes stop_codon:yes gene_type:complete
MYASAANESESSVDSLSDSVSVSATYDASSTDTVTVSDE